MSQPKYAANAIIEAINANIELIVCITEGIPVIDMLKVKQELIKSIETNRSELSWNYNTR